MASRVAVPFLVGMMLLTGVCNTLLTKYQDNQCVRNCNDPDATRRIKFEQPVLQTAQMFVGELGCFVVAGLLALYRRYVAKSSASQRGYEAISTNDHDADISPEDDEQQDPESNANAHKRGYTILLLALPAICDICGTTLINTGLIFVAASIFQMTRGALVLFVGLFSVLFLKRHLKLFQWLALVGVVLGVVIVGLAGAIWPDEKAATSGGTDNLPQDNGGLTPAVKVVIGVLLIAGAQILTATQFVLEEWILENSPIEPIMVVGWEGTYGLVITVILMIVMHFLVGQTEAGQYGYFDMKEGWRQMTTDNRIWVSSLLIMVSIGGFNFFGLSVTRSVSATSRSTIDTCRTLFIWMISLGLGWETFKWLQILGFAFLVYSTFLFNGIVQPPLKCLQTNEEVEELLPEEPIENYR
jgi:drug/metabolite transporter (DMT)-like permease